MSKLIVACPRCKREYTYTNITDMENYLHWGDTAEFKKINALDGNTYMMCNDCSRLYKIHEGQTNNEIKDKFKAFMQPNIQPNAHIPCPITPISGDVIQTSSQSMSIGSYAIDISGQFIKTSGNVVKISGQAMGIGGYLIGISGQFVTISGNVVQIRGVLASGQSLVSPKTGDIVKISGQLMSIGNYIIDISGHFAIISGNIIHIRDQEVLISDQSETISSGNSTIVHRSAEAQSGNMLQIVNANVQDIATSVREKVVIDSGNIVQSGQEVSISGQSVLADSGSSTTVLRDVGSISGNIIQAASGYTIATVSGKVITGSGSSTTVSVSGHTTATVSGKVITGSGSSTTVSASVRSRNIVQQWQWPIRKNKQ